MSRASVLATMVLAVPCLAACATEWHDPAQRYTGTVTPTSTGPRCTASRGVAQVKDGLVLFIPDESTWVLSGIVDPDGSLTADRSVVGGNKQMWDTTLEARWTPTSMTGTYKTPRCTYTVALTAP